MPGLTRSNHIHTEYIKAGIGWKDTQCQANLFDNVHELEQFRNLNYIQEEYNRGGEPLFVVIPRHGSDGDVSRAGLTGYAKGAREPW
jgi:hypothetical protein